MIYSTGEAQIDAAIHDAKEAYRALLAESNLALDAYFEASDHDMPTAVVDARMAAFELIKARRDAAWAELQAVQRAANAYILGFEQGVDREIALRKIGG